MEFSPPAENGIRLTCTKCKGELSVPATAAGKKTRCPHCQQVLDVVMPGSAMEPGETGSWLTGGRASHAHPVMNPLESVVPGSKASEVYHRVTEQVSKMFVGQNELLLGTMVAVFSGGHILIESVPGLGKTMFVRTLGKALGCQFGRIQFTADLMPSDITGSPIFNIKEQEFVFRRGPVFTQLLLCDEINRAPAKTHAALLEIMQERNVTVDGKTHELSPPFVVLATQNPIESEGTYNLPEAQLDRFMFKLTMDYPDLQEESEIVMRHSTLRDLDQRLLDEVSTVTSPEEVITIGLQSESVRVDPLLVTYITRVVRATRNWPGFHCGASPRAAIGLLQGARMLAAFCGRDFAVPDDVVQLAKPVLRHRVRMTAEAEVEGHQVDQLIDDLIRSVEVPRLNVSTTNNLSG